MNGRLLCALGALSCGLVGPAPLGAQSVLFEIDLPAESCRSAGDVNGDGTDDLILGTGFNVLQEVRVVSGVDGSTLTSFTSTRDLGFGKSVHGGADVDGDGIDDFVIGDATYDPWEPFLGRVEVHSLAHGLLFAVDGVDLDRIIGGAVLLPGDLDGDGLSEFAIGVPSLHSSSRGGVLVYAGSDGSLLYQVDGGDTNAYFGEVIDTAGDLDGDGTPDIVASERGMRRARVLSGVDGSTLLTIGEDPQTNSIPYRVAGGGDYDHDGVPDILTLHYDEHKFRSFGMAWSGADGSQLAVWGEERTNLFAQYVRFAGDVDGDGWDDVLISNPADDRDTYLGTVLLYSGRTDNLLYRFLNEEELDDDGPSLMGWDVATANDLDGDGLSEIVIAAGYGKARVHTGSSLYLDAFPKNTIKEGHLLRYRAGNGVPGAPLLLYLLSVNGNPFTFLLARGQFDGNESWTREATIPPGLAGLDLEEILFSLNSNGKVVASDVLELHFR